MHVLGRGLRASGASVGVVGERSEQWGVRASEASGVGGWASEASAGGGAAGRPRIVAEGDVLRVVHNMTGFYLLPSNIHDITSNLTNR